MAWRAMKPAELWCNEVIGKRIPALISNLKRCHVYPAVVINADTGVLADTGPQTADVVLVDAPCSGQSLVARGKKSPGCFHPATINMNAKSTASNSGELDVPRETRWLADLYDLYLLTEGKRTERRVAVKETFAARSANRPCRR